MLTERLLGKVVADFNQDGRLDIALLGPDQFVGQPLYRLLLLARNATNTGYDAPVVSLLSNIQSFQPPLLADSNLDGRPDVVVSSRDANGVAATVVAQRTATGFAVQGPFPALSPSGGDLQLMADADGDGLPDLLGPFAAIGSGGFAVLRGQAGGGFGPPIGYSLAGNTFVTGDFDLDGRTDLAAYDVTSGNLIVYRYTGLGPNTNNPPTLNALADLTIDEDAPPQTVVLTGIGNGGEPGQAVSITAVSDNPALVPTPTIAYFSPTSTLRFRPAPDAFGTCLITVTASDGQPQNGTVVRTFRVTVNLVDDAPTLDAIPDVVVTQPIAQNTTSQIMVPLSDITAGAANENQLLTLSATVTIVSGGFGNTGTLAYTSPTTAGEYRVPVTS